MSSHPTHDDVAYVNALLYTYDPIGIAIPDDEYIAEARIIATSMRELPSEQSLLEHIHQTFCFMFSKSMLAGPIDTYRAIARDIWSYMQNQRSDE
jgi:hypothetical protein